MKIVTAGAPCISIVLLLLAASSASTSWPLDDHHRPMVTKSFPAVLIFEECIVLVVHFKKHECIRSSYFS